MRIWKAFLLANYTAFVYGAINTFLTDVSLHYFVPGYDKNELHDPVRMALQTSISAVVFIAHAEYIQWWIAMDEFRGDLFSWKLSIRVYFGLLMFYVYLNHILTETVMMILNQKNTTQFFLRFLFIGPHGVLLTALCEELGINHTMRRLILTAL
jgi:hypothetical protein